MSFWSSLLGISRGLKSLLRSRPRLSSQGDRETVEAQGMLDAAFGDCVRRRKMVSQVVSKSVFQITPELAKNTAVRFEIFIA